MVKHSEAFCNTMKSIIYLVDSAAPPELALAFREKAFGSMIRFPTEDSCRV